MPSVNVRALNYNCNRCKSSPCCLCEPCGHQVCYDHYLGKNWSLEKRDECCAHCGKLVQNATVLEQPDPVITTINPSTWNIDQPRDDDRNWPTMSGMYGNLNDMNGHGQGHAYGNGYYYENDANGFPTLQKGTGPYKSPGIPPPANGQFPAPTNGHSHFGNGHGAPSQFTQQPQTNGHANGQANGSGLTYLAPPPDYSMSPGPGYLINNADFNPTAPRYIPTPMVEPVIRPESSISNYSNHTFATQASYQHMPGIAAPAPRRPQPQAYGNGMNGLNAGLNGLNISDHQPYGPPPSTIYEEHDNGMSSHDSAIARRPIPDPRYLAEEIMDGKTEDPHDRNMRSYTIPKKLPAPTMGPARFKDTKMFSVAGGTIPVADIDTLTMIPHQKLAPIPKPDWMDAARRGQMKPNLKQAFESLPIIELSRTVNSSTSGVVRISEIPYDAIKPEVISLVGRQAQVSRMPEGSPFHAIHILMERESGKTQDCFVEFASPQEAARVVRQLNAKRDEEGRSLLVGKRHVKLAVSSQDELMAELFPRAKHVRWYQGQPIVDKTQRRYYDKVAADGFSGFIHTEEFHAVKKHANLNERAPFARKSPSRVYESMITMLYKYPWFAVELISARERRALFDCARTLISSLSEWLLINARKLKAPTEPTNGLLQELVAATLHCPGFTEKQKASLTGTLISSGFGDMTRGRSVNIVVGGQHPLSIHWPFAALSIHPGADAKLVDIYAGLLHEAASSSTPGDGDGAGAGSLAALQQAKSTGGYLMDPVGNFTIQYGDDPDNISLADMARVEYRKVEQLLRIVCPRPGHEKPSSVPNSMGPEYDTRGSGSCGVSSTGASAGARSI